MFNELESIRGRLLAYIESACVCKSTVVGSLLRLYENISTPWAFVLIAVVGIFPGVSEELFFRGFVQRRLLHRYSPVTAIGITTILFALLHVTPHGIALASVMGIWLGVVAWRIGSIWPSVACHASSIAHGMFIKSVASNGACRICRQCGSA